MGKLSEALIGEEPYFDGHTYHAPRDQARLSGQLYAVSMILADYQWHTLEELADKTGASVASVSARIRDLRKTRFGGRTIDRKYFSNGLWRYRLVK